MRSELVKSNAAFLRPLQLMGAVITLFLGIAMFLQIYVPDASRDPKVKFSGYIPLAALFIGPSLFVLVGSYVQLRHQKLWAMILLFVGGLWNLFFVAFFVGFTFLYAQDRTGQIEVVADLVVVISTLGLALGNIVMMNKVEA
jgi:hypothetical protein